MAQALAGTSLLELRDSVDVHLMDGAHAFVDRKIRESIDSRKELWSRDYSSNEA